MHIREALPGDAEAACSVMRRSIAELCHADHRNDPAILARWAGNKTPQNLCSWLEQGDNSLFVAVEGDVVLGVGSVTDAGRIGLNYVSPEARFQASGGPCFMRSSSGPRNAATLGSRSKAPRPLGAFICRMATPKSESRSKHLARPVTQ
jgi:hypothetical protein